MLSSSLWSHRNDDEREAHREIEESHDRAAAVVAAAFVEDRLATALKARFHQDEAITGNLFRSSGPLGSFKAKIDLAYLVGLCSKEAHSDLDIIRRIRNEFAHELTTKTFESQRVNDLTKNFALIKTRKIRMRSADDAADAAPIHVFPPIDKPFVARDSYIVTCQMLIWVLDVLGVEHPSPPASEI
jgi:DNA-binding MltR family transcriptional regulator